MKTEEKVVCREQYRRLRYKLTSSRRQLCVVSVFDAMTMEATSSEDMGEVTIYTKMHKTDENQLRRVELKKAD